MKLKEVLAADRIASGVTVTSKKRALEELSKLLSEGTPALGESDILSALSGREKLGSTGLGHGVAIPHGRMAGIEQAVGAFVRLKHPVDYDAHDGQAVDLMFGLLVPQAATEQHLKILAAIAESFSDEAFCASLRETGDAGALLELFGQ